MREENYKGVFEYYKSTGISTICREPSMHDIYSLTKRSGVYPAAEFGYDDRPGRYDETIKQFVAWLDNAVTLRRGDFIVHRDEYGVDPNAIHIIGKDDGPMKNGLNIPIGTDRIGVSVIIGETDGYEEYDEDDENDDYEY